MILCWISSPLASYLWDTRIDYPLELVSLESLSFDTSSQLIPMNQLALIFSVNNYLHRTKTNMYQNCPKESNQICIENIHSNDYFLYFSTILIGIWSNSKNSSFLQTFFPLIPAMLGPKIFSTILAWATTTGQFLRCDHTTMTKFQADTPVMSRNFRVDVAFWTSRAVCFVLFSLTVVTSVWSTLCFKSIKNKPFLDSRKHNIDSFIQCLTTKPLPLSLS